MEVGLIYEIAVGASFGLAALGSCWGAYVVGMATIGDKAGLSRVDSRRPANIIRESKRFRNSYY
jgi:hypothetical protein